MPLIAFPVVVPEVQGDPETQAAITKAAKIVAQLGANYVTDVLDCVDHDTIQEYSKDPKDIAEDFAKYLYDLYLKGSDND